MTHPENSPQPIQLVLSSKCLAIADKLLKTTGVDDYSVLINLLLSRYGSHLEATWDVASSSTSSNQSIVQFLEEMLPEEKAMQEREATLNEIKITEAKNRGAARALAIFQAEQEAEREVLAQLWVKKLDAEGK